MIDFTTLTLVDYGIVFVFVLSATMSILRGLTREIPVSYTHLTLPTKA